jgi:hypothetical protein
MARGRKSASVRTLRDRVLRVRSDLTTARDNSETLIDMTRSLGQAVAEAQADLRALRDDGAASSAPASSPDTSVVTPTDDVAIRRPQHAGQTVIVSSNCATGGVGAALAAMLPGDTVVPVPWMGEMTPVLDEALTHADIWVTSTPGPSIDAILRESGRRSPRVIRIPNLVFEAFHPDLTYIPDPAGGWVKSPADDYNSAIVFWGWKHGLDAEQILARFSPQTCLALGYGERWGQAVQGMRAHFELSDLSFEPFFLRMRRRSPFMLGVNHPRIDALIELARQVSAILEAPEDLRRFPWESVLPDALLAAGPVWPVYPAVAAALSLPGGFVWRCPGGRLLDLEQFVVESLAGYASYDPDELKLPLFDHPVFDDVLSVEPTGER